MKKQRFTEEKILTILKEHESGKKVQDICRTHGISDATLNNWKNKYTDMQLQELKRLCDLESENSKLKRIVADLNLENFALKDLIEKHGKPMIIRTDNGAEFIGHIFLDWCHRRRIQHQFIQPGKPYRTVLLNVLTAVTEKKYWMPMYFIRYLK